MFEDDPGRRATLIGGIVLIALIIGMATLLFLLATEWGRWAH